MSEKHLVSKSPQQAFSQEFEQKPRFKDQRKFSQPNNVADVVNLTSSLEHSSITTP